jgi:hypothetical protein
VDTLAKFTEEHNKRMQEERKKLEEEKKDCTAKELILLNKKRKSRGWGSKMSKKQAKTERPTTERSPSKPSSCLCRSLRSSSLRALRSLRMLWVSLRTVMKRMVALMTAVTIVQRLTQTSGTGRTTVQGSLPSPSTQRRWIMTRETASDFSRISLSLVLGSNYFSHNDVLKFNFDYSNITRHYFTSLYSLFLILHV